MSDEQKTPEELEKEKLDLENKNKTVDENPYLKLYEEEKKKSDEQTEQLKKKNEQISNLTKANKEIRQRSRSEVSIVSQEESEDENTTDDEGDEVVRAPSGKLYKKRHIDDIMDMVRPNIEQAVKPVLDKTSRFEILDEIKRQADTPEQQQVVEHLYWNKFKPSGNVKEDVADVIAYVRGKTGGIEPNPINRRMGVGGSSYAPSPKKNTVTEADLEMADMFGLTKEDLQKSSGGIKRL